MKKLGMQTVKERRSFDYTVQELSELPIHKLEILRYDEYFYKRVENIGCTNMENSYGNINSDRLRNSHNCTDCKNMGESSVCNNSAQCKGCIGCSNCYKCIDCINLENGLFCRDMKISQVGRIKKKYLILRLIFGESKYTILNRPATKKQFNNLKRRISEALKERNKKSPKCNKKAITAQKSSEEKRDIGSGL